MANLIRSSPGQQNAGPTDLITSERIGAGVTPGRPEGSVNDLDSTGAILRARPLAYDPAVGYWLTGGVLGLALLAQSTTPGCDPQPPPPTPSPPATAAVTFTTQDGVRVQADAIVSSLEVPWALAFAQDGRLFVAERAGRVRIVNLSTSTSEIALTLDDVFRQGEAGLLGLALAPDFAATRLVYLYYSAVVGNGAVNRIARYREAGGRLAERAVLLDNIPAATIHDGGRLRFGPDGLLYATAGDAANSSLAQDRPPWPASSCGSTATGWRRGATRSDRHFQLGAPQPAGIRLAPTTGEISATEHGNSGNDEINVIRAGVNYRWPTIEAAQTFPNMEPPVTFFNPRYRTFGCRVLSRHALSSVRRQPLRGDAARDAPAPPGRGCPGTAGDAAGAAARRNLRPSPRRRGRTGRLHLHLHQQP